MPETSGYDSGPSYGEEKNKLLASFEKQIKRCERNWDDAFNEIHRSRRLLGGEVPDSVPHEYTGIGILDARGEPISAAGTDAIGGKKRVRANLLLATNESMLPLVYARNPDVSIRPAEQVHADGPEYEHLKAWAETLQITLSKQLRTGGLKKQAKKVVRSIQAAKVGWLKMTYQRDYGQDPRALNRIPDLQDNLAEIEGRIRALAEDDDATMSTEQEELKAQQLRQMIKGLEDSPEVMLAEGLVIDHVATDNMRMDPGVTLLEDYTRAKWLAHYDEMAVDDYRHQYNVDEDGMKGVKLYRKKPAGEGVESRSYTPNSTDTKSEECVRLWELWHRVDNTIYTWCEGAMDFAREPWVPQGLGERWYPFFLVGFHWIDASAWPQSAVDLLEGLQQEYNDTREQKNEHRRANVPHYVASSDVSPESVKSFTIAGAREVVILDVEGRPLNEIITPSVQIPLNPAMYDASDTLTDMQWVSGVQDAARGGVVKAKTLGEAEIAQSHLASRSGNFQDELEEVLTEMSVYGAQILLQKMRPETVAKIAGPNAVWPQLPREDIFDLFDIEIRAGSTGKPDERVERDQWTELLPQITNLVMKILEMRQTRQLPDGSVVPGMPDHMNPLVKIFEETLKRFDERIDIEQFLPPEEATGQQPPQPPMMGAPGGGIPAAGGNGQGAMTGLPGSVTQPPPYG